MAEYQTEPTECRNAHSFAGLSTEFSSFHEPIPKFIEVGGTHYHHYPSNWNLNYGK